MATFTVSIAEAINVWGGEPTSKWGDMVWGVDNWAFGSEDLIVTVFKNLDDTVSISDEWTVIASFRRTLSDTVSVAGQMSDETLIDSAGYRHVFVGGVVNGEDRSLTSFTSVARASDTYTEVSRPSTDWSEN